MFFLNTLVRVLKLISWFDRNVISVCVCVACFLYWFGGNDTLYVIVSLPALLEFSPPVDKLTEDEVAKLLTDAGGIVSRMQTQDSTITALLNKLEQNMSDLEKDYVREGLKQEISTALEAGGIPRKIEYTLTMLLVSLSMNNTLLVKAKRFRSIMLYLRCLSLESLWMLREMILSGLLLRLLSEAIKQLIESRHRVELIVQREDFNLCLSCYRGATGKHDLFTGHYISYEQTDSMLRQVKTYLNV